MKANVWQILGLILVIAGVVLFARKKIGTNDTTAPPSNHTAPAAATATAPTTQP
jgi:hypothetical protein